MDRISFGNTIKKEKDIAWAYQQGVRLFAFDSEAELQKLARVAPGARVFCRVLVDCGGAEWPLSKKFGCAPEMAKDLLRKAKEWGLDAYGISFHVGSQQTDLEQWDKALGQVSQMFFALAEEGVDLRMVNLGGGFPARYRAEVNSIEAYCEAVGRALVRHFGNRMPEVIIEPGRSMVGDAGVIQSEVVLVSRKAANDRKRWVYLDIGKFRGLAETMGESIKYRLRTGRDGTRVGPGGAGRPDLRQRRHPLREDRVQAAAVAEARRQGRDPLDRRLHDDLLVGRLQRLRAAQGDLHLSPRFHTGTNRRGLEKGPVAVYRPLTGKAGTLKWRRKSRASETSKKYVDFKGRMVMIGFGSIGQGVLPLILRHIGIKPEPDHHHPPRTIAAACRRPKRYGVDVHREAPDPRQLPPDAGRPAGQGRLPGQPVGRGRLDGAGRALPGEGRALPRHLHRAVAGRLHRSQPLGVAALQLRAARHHAEARAASTAAGRRR